MLIANGRSMTFALVLLSSNAFSQGIPIMMGQCVPGGPVPVEACNCRDMCGYTHYVSTCSVRMTSNGVYVLPHTHPLKSPEGAPEIGNTGEPNPGSITKRQPGQQR